MPPYRPLAVRYHEKIDRSGGPDACHPWTAFCGSWGYGIIGLERGNGTGRAHRVGWELTFGPIPPGKIVCHSCDNPPCQNPTHWFLGTHSDNSRDRERKRRGRKQQGELGTNASLTAAQVLEIRQRAQEGISQRELARMFGVTRSAISHIIARRNWNHL